MRERFLPLYFARQGELLKTVRASDIAHLLPMPSSHRIVRDYSLDSILAVRWRGVKYKVLHDKPLSEDAQ